MIPTEIVLAGTGGSLAITGGVIAILTGWVAISLIVCAAALFCGLALFYFT
jgi:hypothetical protein